MSTKRQPTTEARRKRKKWLMNKAVWPVLAPLAYALGVVVCILFLPVILPFGAVVAWLETREKRAIAARFACTRCGVLLGDISLSLANAMFRELDQQLRRELRRDEPHMEHYFIRTLDAICPHCRQRYTYVEKERTFTKEADGQWADRREA